MGQRVDSQIAPSAVWTLRRRVSLATAVVAVGLSSFGFSSVAGAATHTKADVALAKKELLPASAYPKGWKGQGSGSTNTQASFFGGSSTTDVLALASCLGVSAKKADTHPAEAASQEYDDPNSNTEITDTVDVFPTEAAAQFDERAGASPKAAGCLTKLVGPYVGPSIAAGMGEGATVGTVGFTSRHILISGTNDADVTMSAPFNAQGISGTLYIETLAVEKGRSESTFTFTNSSPLSAAEIKTYGEAAAKRMAS